MQSLRDLLNGIDSWHDLIIIGPILVIIGIVIKKKIEKYFSDLLETVAAYLCFHHKKLPEYKKYIRNKYQIIQTPFINNKLELSMNNLYIKCRLNTHENNDDSDVYIDYLLDKYEKIIVTGAPGTGKSLLCKSILLDYSKRRKFSKKSIPVLINLYKINSNDDFIELIAKQFISHNINQSKIFVLNMLKRDRLLLLFDGLDEINDKERKNVVNKIDDFLLPYNKCNVLVTCRSSVYNNEFQDNWKKVKRANISDFNDCDIKTFLYSLPSVNSKNKSPEHFFKNLKEQPQQAQELFKNPLLLTLAAYLYLFTDTFNVFPSSRSIFYREAIDILLSSRQPILGDSKFTYKEKERALQEIAYLMQIKNKTAITYDNIKDTISSIINSEDNIKLILNDIRGRSGLIYISDRRKDEYQFSHLTFKDFFVAQKINHKDLALNFFENPDGWREPVKFWCGLVEDSSSLIREIFPLPEPITALECLTDIQHINQNILKDILYFFQQELGNPDQKDIKIICKILGIIASDLDSKQGKAVFKMLKETLRASRSRSEIKAVADALSCTYRQESAQLLSRYIYKSGVKEALCRMGDVAIEGIEKLAIKGDIKAMDSLRLINEPNALKALVKSALPLIERVERKYCVFYAAWHLASLLPNPQMQDVFQEHNVDNMKNKEGIAWIWHPFKGKKEKDSNIPIIAGRISPFAHFKF